MSKPLPKVHFINPASVRIGDVIRATWKIKDLEHSRSGRVAKREYEGGYRVLLTAGGEELFRWHPEYDKRVRVTILEPAPLAPAETLFDVVS